MEASVEQAAYLAPVEAPIAVALALASSERRISTPPNDNSQRTEHSTIFGRHLRLA